MDDMHARAVEEARLVLHARQELYGESDPATFDAMLQFGRALRDAGDLRQAERVLTASLSLQNRSEDGNEAGVRWTEFNLAIVLDRLGEHEAARRRWEQVLASSDLDDAESELSTQTAINLAITLRKLRRYGDEFPLRVRVLESARRRLGPDSPEPRSTSPRHTGIWAITNWPWGCSPRLWRAWNGPAGTSARSCCRNGRWPRS